MTDNNETNIKENNYQHLVLYLKHMDITNIIIKLFITKQKYLKCSTWSSRKLLIFFFARYVNSNLIP